MLSTKSRLFNLASSQSKWANKAYKEQDVKLESMMKTYMSGFAIDEEAADAEVPSDEEVPIPNDYKPLKTERQRKMSHIFIITHNIHFWPIWAFP